MEKRNSQFVHGQPMEQTRGLFCTCDDVRSVLHGQVSLAAVYQICVIHEAMNGCKNIKMH